MEEDKDFLRQDQDYHTLMAFRKAECIYDVTYYFAHQFLQKGDRTIDQMIQAARSGKQNIAEGTVDGLTSREMEMKLLNVNRGSLHELLQDYEDFLRVRSLEIWKWDDSRCRQARAFCRNHLDSAVYREKIKVRSAETIANIAITLIHQCDALLRGLIEWKKKQFKEQGGIKEEMYRARTEWRKQHGYGGYGSSYGVNGGNYGVNGVNGQATDRCNARGIPAPTAPIHPTNPINPSTPGTTAPGTSGTTAPSTPGTTNPNDL